MTIQNTRIQSLNKLDIVDGKYVLYWMQQSQRADCNHALEYAIQEANHLRCSLLVAFGLTDNYPEANLRHYAFMLEGLQETRATLADRGIQMVVQLGSPPDVALALGKEACLIVCDRGYLKHQRTWRHEVAAKAPCRVVQVESDVIVPVEVVSPKAEYAARTIRPKIHRHLEDYLNGLKKTKVGFPSLGMPIDGLNLKRMEDV